MAHREIPCSAAGAEAAVMPEAVAVGPWARNGADPAAVLLTPNRLELIFWSHTQQLLWTLLSCCKLMPLAHELMRPAAAHAAELLTARMSAAPAPAAVMRVWLDKTIPKPHYGHCTEVNCFLLRNRCHCSELNM